LKIFKSIHEFVSEAKTIVTLGTFDGVHTGHKSILEKLMKSSRASGCESVVLTFFPHPRMVLQQNTDIRLLNTIDEKAMLLEEYGIDNLIIHPFDHAFSRLSAEEFVKDLLVDKLNICKIIIGHDHRFGRNRTADINDLIAYGKEFGFEVEQISALEINEVSVSSTKIRNALLEGNIETANKYLGYPYFFTGTVVQGRQLGRTINFPTANIKIPEDYKLIPSIGIYVVSSMINDVRYYGMMSIGTNPTVGGTSLSVEVYYFDLDEDLYGKELRVDIYYRMRDELKFASIDELQQQLEEDRRVSLEYIKNKLA
jgi:riboflavin kinase/FMN adenylyltransferase